MQLEVDSLETMERIIWIFPKELYNEKILMDNINNTQKYLKDYSYELDQVRISGKILEELKFDIQKERQRKVLNSHMKKLEEIEEKINENLSPYFWVISQNENDPYGFKFGRTMKARYVLHLEKIN